jgi:hypothetical protein
MKKLILLLSATAVLVSCSKVGKGEYLITGKATGIENGKTIVLETQDAVTGALLAKDTVKVLDGKFEMKGKITEPAFYALQLESSMGKEPYQKIQIILESAEVIVEINKDSIQNSKVTGTYSNDEFANFNKELKIISKPITDFEKRNTQTMKAAKEANDTVTMGKLMKDYSALQTQIGDISKKKYLTYAESHPKSFISTLIIQGMLGDPTVDVAKAEKIYNSLDEVLKNTTAGKAAKIKLAELKNPTPAIPSMGGGTLPQAPPAPAAGK